MSLRFSNFDPFRRCALALGLVGLLSAAPRFDHPRVPDVPAAFARIDPTGNRLGVWTAGVIAYPFYSLNPDHDFGDNHFQGVQRLRAGPYVVVAGSNISRLGDLARFGLPPAAGIAAMPPPQGDLFVLRLTSRPARGEFGSNVEPRTLLPAAEDRARVAVPISIPLPSGTTLWHPGGIGSAGDILVVPVENYNPAHGEVCSQILFYDMAEPEKPTLLPVRIDRTGPPLKDKAGAATMARLRDGRLLVAARTSTHLSLYRTRTRELADGFEATPTAIFDESTTTAAPGVAWAKFHGSSFHFVTQADGTLFFVSFSRVREESDDSDARYGGRHTATLFRLDLIDGGFGAPPAIVKVAERGFGAGVLGYDGWGDFAAAPGVFVTDGGGIALYAAPRWQVARVARHRLEEVKLGIYPRADEPCFIPLAEFWPR